MSQGSRHITADAADELVADLQLGQSLRQLIY
jgi:hypothetical protein